MRPIADPTGPIAAELRSPAGVAIEILANGAIFAIRHGGVLVNQVLGSPVEGGLGNLYLRRRTRAGVAAVPLLGPASASRLRTSADAATWEGSFDGVDYACTLRLAPGQPSWFWTVELENRRRGAVSVDAVLAQDLGIADEGAVRASELYTSQYIDHTVLEDPELGFLLCSRQNLPQGGAFPWIMHGCLDGAAGFVTDGVQFHGLEYKATNLPAALGRRTLPNRVYQYELAMPTLQSRRVHLAPAATAEIAFFAAFVPDHPAATSDGDARWARAARTAYGGLRRDALDGPPRQRVRSLFDAPAPFETRDLGPAELEHFFGAERRHAERLDDGTLLSFFHGTQQHVVLRAKELIQERPTGHIMRSGRDQLPSDDTLSVTAWMFGVFGSQLAIGNTSFNTLLSVVRNPLNALKASGQRILVRTDAGWELLGLPSAFEMGPNSARWIYHGERHTLSVRAEAALDAPAYRLQLDVERGGPLQVLVSHDVVLGASPGDPPGRVAIDATGARVELRPAPETPMGGHYPEATFFIVPADPEAIEAIGGDGLLRPDGVDRGGSFVVLRTKPVVQFSLTLTGSVTDAGRATALATAAGHRPADAPGAEQEIARFWAGLAGGATIGGGSGRTAEDVAQLDDALRWNVHDAMIHFTTPHGLEQHNGAAWGVRDVCQGPAELLVATGHLDALRSVLKIVYEHQFRETGDWPQWFMFDRYREVQAEESHADVIHWPLKALCDYVEASGDASILDEPVAYTDGQTKAATTATESIFAHTERQIARIEDGFIRGTALVAFGGGDWEDTLQPVDPAMAARMVSAWTVELAYQTLERYRAVCERAGRVAMAQRLADLCDRMRADFNRHLVPDGVVAGLAHFGADGVEYFLHPRDRRTGVSYRLLPMTRGMISGLFTDDQAARHFELIRRHLSFPDGVRLMDRPMAYHGGPSHTFRRAESAANFGREIGLQYVHAHVRYIEAMARIGRPEEAFAGLLAVCPIRLDLRVPNALPRQANAFFSSSDAAFLDRRQASRQFHRLRSGRVGVKGGWRVYSSGPGIYLNQLISNVLGLRSSFDDVVIDPVLPRDADGLTFDLERDGRRIRYRYRVEGRGFAPDGVRVNGVPLPSVRAAGNPYRADGLLVTKREFTAALDRRENIVDVIL
ncbi:MAG TPA: cellobiose phosphorylase [Patescibacteria group bacterium]|nr:cellobiose phosphorylase [Patescibacteria group bacterium]